MLNIDAIRTSMVGTFGTNAKKNRSYENSISQQQPKQAMRTLNPSEAASMLYASGASGAARVTFSEQNTAPPSIYDFSKDDLQIALDEIKAEGQGISYEGMSDAEIYNAIVKRYMDKFGADLGVPSASREWVDMNEMPNINTPKMAMDNEIYNAISDVKKLPQIIREANGYADLSDAEITERVKEKYPDTLRGYNCMQRELSDMGINSGGDTRLFLLNMMHSSGALKQDRGSGDMGELWTTLLDTRVSFDSIDKFMSDFEANGKKMYAPEQLDISLIHGYLGIS